MSDYTITASSELMQNYLQAEILAPDAKFEAQQAAAGTSLLFSVGTDGTFYVTEELPGNASGWNRWDLSGAQTAKDFPAGGVTCKDFATAQSTGNGASPVDLAMVLQGPDNDHLYLSLGNSESDTSWVSGPAWTAYPFDDPNHPLKQVRIVGLAVSHAADGEYVVVDVVRDPVSPVKLVFRYYLDPAKAGGYAWHPHDVSTDLEVGRYLSCLGRRAGQRVEGLYTAGRVGTSAQFTYQPLYNPFNPKLPANPSRLQLPGAVVPDAIAACRLPDGSSDLYAVNGGALYYFQTDNQADGATGVAVLEDRYLGGVRSLYAELLDDSVIVWGLNGSDEVFYTTCPRTRLAGDHPAWTPVLPILASVEQVSPYVDCGNSAKTFFAHTGQGRLTKAVKAPETTIWTFQSVTLPPPTTTVPAQRFNSYTTRVQVVGQDGQPAVGVPVTISASAVASAYVNNLYYVLGPGQIDVRTDPLGVVTVVQPLTSLVGVRLNFSVDGAQADVNPMHKPFQKAASLTTVDQLQAATITAPDGSTRPLVPPGTSPDKLQGVAAANAQLAKAYAAVTTGPPPSLRAEATSPLGAARPASISGLAAVSTVDVSDAWSSVLVDAGDLFSWMAEQVESGLQYVVDLIVDTATGAWNFFVEIAGEAYHCVLDAVEKVVGAVEWLYAAVKTGIEDLLAFLGFLFEWGDITRTKRVITNFAKLFLDDQVEQIEVVKEKFDGVIEQARSVIDGWSGVQWNGLGADGTAAPSSRSTPAAGQSAPGSLLAQHYQANVQSATPIGQGPSVAPSSNPIEVLLQTVGREAGTLGTAIDQLQALADGFDTRPVADSLAQLVGIVADAVLESARNVTDALFDVLYDIAKAAVAALYTPIHIPVVSDILSDFGVPSFSFLDVACWIAAVPVTVAYKAATGTAPFPDTPQTTFLMTVTDYPTLLQAFSPVQSRPPELPAPQTWARLASAAPTGSAPASSALASSPPAGAALAGAASASQPAGPPAAGSGPIPIDPSTASAVHITGHALSGFFSLVGAILSGYEAAGEGGDANPWGIPSAVTAILGGVSSGLAGALVPYDPIQNQVVAEVSKVTTGIRILEKILFSGPAQKAFSASATFGRLAVSDGRGVGAVVDAVLVLPALACTCWHFYELGEKPESPSRSIAIVDETSSLTAYISRVSYAIAVNTEAEVKAVAIGVMTVANVCTGGLQIAEAAIH